jgi:hypothetical protein
MEKQNKSRIQTKQETKTASLSRASSLHVPQGQPHRSASGSQQHAFIFHAYRRQLVGFREHGANCPLRKDSSFVVIQAVSSPSRVTESEGLQEGWLHSNCIYTKTEYQVPIIRIHNRFMPLARWKPAIKS